MVEALNQLVTTLFAEAGVIPTVFGWITSGNVLPYFSIGIGCSLCLFGVKAIKSVIWGA